MADAVDVVELCRLVVGADRQRILAAIERLENKPQLAEHLSTILGDAVRLGAAYDERLRDALAPLVSQGVHDTIKRDPVSFGEALAPAMGPAIRRSVRQMLQSFIDGFERALDASLSPRGWKWRFEAWRTGKSFGEVVFVHTLRFRVEHAFLIHGHTGLLLQHVANANVKVREPGLISAMLTAIRDFVGDAFEAPDSDALGAIQVGDLDVWVETGQRAVLALVIRGQAPRSLRAEMSRTIEQIELGCARQLQAFDGDADAFEVVRPELERCLVEQLRDATPTRRRRSWLPTTIAAVVVVALAWWWFTGWRQERRWQQYLAQLRQTPGVVVTHAERNGGRYVVNGWRDPLADDPAALATASGLPLEALDARWSAFHAGVPGFVLTRLRRALTPPATVALTLDVATLRVTGRASHRWIDRLRDHVSQIASIDTIDCAALVDTDIETLAAARERVATRAVALVDSGPGYQTTDLAALIADLEPLLAAARALEQPLALVCRARVGADADDARLERSAADLFAGLRAAIGPLVCRYAGKLVAAGSADSAFVFTIEL